MNNSEERIKKAIETMKEKLGTIRAGRANPAMLNKVMVPYYGVPSPINAVANITVPEAKQIFIKPFEKSVLKDIEKAIIDANLGVSPTNNGEMIIITIPDLTEDRRREYVKSAKAMGEDGKVALRNIRQDVKDAILKEKYPEDEEKGMLEDLQELINKYNKVIDEEINNKEKELMQM